MTTKSKLTAARRNSQVLVDSLRRLSSNEALKGQARRRPEKTTKFGQKAQASFGEDTMENLLP